MKTEQMVEKYKEFRNQGFSYASAAHAVLKKIRGKNKHERVDAFLSNPFVAAEAKAFSSSLKV